MVVRYVAGVVLAVMAATAAAQVEVKDAWARATVPAQKASGAFMRLTAATDTRLVEVRSPVAGIAELHEMSLVDNVMKMRPVPGIDLPAGRAVELKPSGFHVMLMDLKQQLKDGDTVPITLVLEGKDGRRSTVDVQAAIKAPGQQDPHKH